MSGIILITGNMAAGKSTVAQALAERLPMSVHLRGDRFRRMIVNGQAEMSNTDHKMRRLGISRCCRGGVAITTGRRAN